MLQSKTIYFSYNILEYRSTRCHMKNWKPSTYTLAQNGNSPSAASPTVDIRSVYEKIYDMSYLRRNKLEKYSNLFGVFGWFFLRSIFVWARALVSVFGTRHWFIRRWHSTQCAFIYRVYLMGISVSITHVCHSIFHHFQHGFYTVSIHIHTVVVVIARCYSSIRIFDFGVFLLLLFFFIYSR